jgi:hypothetical protein
VGGGGAAGGGANLAEARLKLAAHAPCQLDRVVAGRGVLAPGRPWRGAGRPGRAMRRTGRSGRSLTVAIDDRAQQPVAQCDQAVRSKALEDRFERGGGGAGLAQRERQHGGGLADSERAQPRLQLVRVEPAGERLRQNVARHVALQELVALVEQLREHALGDRDERQLIRHLEQREAALARRVEDRGGHLLVHEAGAESEPRDLALGEPLDELALGLCPHQLQSRGQQELAPAQPRRGVEQLGGVHPAHADLRVFLARGER